MMKWNNKLGGTSLRLKKRYYVGGKQQQLLCRDDDYDWTHLEYPVGACREAQPCMPLVVQYDIIAKHYRNFQKIMYVWLMLMLLSYE